ncbi:MAG: hypothetical protein ACPGID_11885 [Rubricella sp.]
MINRLFPLLLVALGGCAAVTDRQTDLTVPVDDSFASETFQEASGGGEMTIRSQLVEDRGEAALCALGTLDGNDVSLLDARAARSEFYARAEGRTIAGTLAFMPVVRAGEAGTARAACTLTGLAWSPGLAETRVEYFYRPERPTLPFGSGNTVRFGVGIGGGAWIRIGG